MSSDDLKQRIEAIETGYEFMLAYAAQGRQTDKGGGSGSKLREHLRDMATALDGLGAAATAAAAAVDGDLPKVGQAFFSAVDHDAGIALAALRLVLARADISSQMIDNLNASIHLRALLTDLFVVDEALRPSQARA
jgi:alkylation response protein AidB-like acyl-CoA dehydrogenase